MAKGGMSDGGVLIAGFLVEILHVLFVVEEFEASSGWPILEVSFFWSFLRLIFLIADDSDVGDDGFALDLVGEVNALRGVGEFDLDVEEEAGVVKAGLVLLDGGVEEALAFLAADVGADEGVADGGRADVLDGDFMDDGPGSCARARRGRRSSSAPRRRRKYTRRFFRVGFI